MALQVQRKLKYFGTWKTVYITSINDMKKAQGDAKYYIAVRKNYGFGWLFDWRIMPYNP